MLPPKLQEMERLVGKELSGESSGLRFTVDFEKKCQQKFLNLYLLHAIVRPFSVKIIY